MDGILLIADNDVSRHAALRRFFSGSGFLVAGASDGLECLTRLVALQPDVLVIALDIPWGGGDGVMAVLDDRLPMGRQPLVLVVGDAPTETLSAQPGSPMQLLLDAAAPRRSARRHRPGTRRDAGRWRGRRAVVEASRPGGTLAVGKRAAVPRILRARIGRHGDAVARAGMD